jgi:hypothetical protein
MVYRKARWLVPTLAVLLFLGCNLLKDTELPAELLGTWVTEEPRYSDCRLEFRETLVIFSKGIGYTNTNVITGVDRTKDEGRIRYRITYEDREGQEYRLSFSYTSANGEAAIRFKNQDQFVWKKRSQKRPAPGS